MKMDINLIKKLLEKYYEGDTTLEEEAVLRDYFNNEDVPEELRIYQAQFAFYQKEKDIMFDNYGFEFPDVNKSHRRKKVIYWIPAAAAAVLLIISLIIMLPQNPFSKKRSNIITVSDPDSTYMITKYALYTVSENLNEGFSQLEKLQYINDGFNAINKLNKINSNFSNTELK